MRTLRVHRLGRVEYADGLGLMRLAAERVRAREPAETDWLFLLEHPPVLTLGRAADGAHIVASAEWLRGRGFEVHETDRGGDVTYHGPGQLVAYPVVDLADRPDVRRFVHDLEEAMIRACRDFGVVAGRHPEHRGAWVGPRKIGAVGVHLSRWVSTHGIALNVAPDLSHFSTIVPCGIAEPGLGVTSLSAELERSGEPPPALADAEERFAAHLAELLGRRREDRGFDLHTVSVVPTAADGRVLLLRRSEARGGFWQPVTGRIEPGETPAEAARRELLEETGIDAAVDPLGYRHGFGLEPGLGGRGDDLRTAEETAFRARVPAAGAVRLSEEHAEHAWLSLAEAESRLRYAGLKKAVRLATAGARTA
ncbi:MAG TPA: lipoyl(octanoyl) transferase LipB [Anaeromyxobacteraceae bacterium]|nr:lipoyl(octanoyl) transferase LipB [Anaeromyxobacteraceae bacterium]